MEFGIKIRKIIENGKPLKATCSVTMDNMFTVHGVNVITTGERQLYRYAL